MASKPPPLPSQFNLTPKMAGIIAGAILIVAMLLTTFYPVPADSVAVVLRFGKYVRTEGRGLQTKLPLGIEQKIIVPVLRQQNMEFGFNSMEAHSEQDMVTGDRNATLVQWVIQYKISDAQQYLFKVFKPDETLRDASESVMRRVVGDRTVDEVITTGRQGIEVEALKELQELVNSYEMGITIDQVQLRDVNPPTEVQMSFNEVNQAEQEKDKAQNEAFKQRNEVIPNAEGDADKIISEAQGYALQRVNEAEGDAARFNSLFIEYQKAPEITKRRIYLETAAEVYPKLGKKIILDDDGASVLPLLNLNDSQP